MIFSVKKISKKAEEPTSGRPFKYKPLLRWSHGKGPGDPHGHSYPAGEIKTAFENTKKAFSHYWGPGVGIGNRRRKPRTTSWLGCALLLGGLVGCSRTTLAPVPDSLAAEICGPALTAGECAQFYQRFMANCHTGESFDDCSQRQSQENTATFFGVCAPDGCGERAGGEIGYEEWPDPNAATK